MKNTIVIIISLLTFLSCKAQIIEPIYNVEETPVYDNTYYKDVDNDYNNFIGTWRWQDGNNILEITFNKSIYYTDGDGDYFDHLVGEYVYIENGVEVINTLPSLLLTNPDGTPNIVKPDPYDNNIKSYDIRTRNVYITNICNECAPNTRFVILTIYDPTRPKVEGKIIMGIFTENGVEKIKAEIGVSFIDSHVTYTGPTTLTIPDGIYTFTKVE